MKNVEGSSTAIYVFNIGGNKKPLINKAKEDLLKNNPLKEGEELANITVSFKNSIYPIVGLTTCTVTADIIKFKN